MKKYLMTGMAALAICAAFTSCSKETNLYNEEVIKENTVQDIINNYEAAFIKTFGQPAANQDWGFSDKAGTRDGSTYMNGNMEEYKDAPTLKENEDAEITAYVRQLTEYPHVAPTNLKTYFVKQVHCGTEYYSNADGGAGILGSSKMNNLQIAMKSGGVIEDGNLSTEGDWIHINNFNRGDDTDWNGNTLVQNGGTYNFAYHGAEDSQYHDRWISVKGEDVDAYYNAKGTYTGAKYAGFYYICFDFEATIGGPTRLSDIKYFDPVINDWRTSSTVDIPGVYTKEQIEGGELDLEVAIPAESHWDSTIGEYGATVVDRYVYVNLSNSDQVEWAHFSNVLDGNKFIEGNNKYDDWIVRLVEAEPKNTETGADLRIVCEDLSVGDGDEGDEDFDFNDVVIDVYYGEKGQAKAKILAAGGTLQLTVDGQEVHTLFANANPGYDCAGKMINTNGTKSADANVCSKSLDGLTAPEITLSEEVKTPQQARDNIKIKVFKGDDWIELDAVIGKVASKVRVGTDYTWKNEREYVGDGFKDFVAGKVGYTDWYKQPQ